MNYARIAIAAVAGVILLVVWGFLVEGVLIRKEFQPYQAVYRTQEAMRKSGFLGFACLLVAVFVLALIYAKWCGGAPSAGSGLAFGLLVGLFAACVHPLSNFVTMNLGAKLSLEIAVSTFFAMGALGALFGTIYRP
jgi:hypothetical protein